MNIVKYKDEDLFRMIREGHDQRGKALHQIYNSFQLKVFKIVRSKGYSTEASEDALQEGIILLDKKIRNGKCEYQKEGALLNYFTSMCIMIAYSKKRSMKNIEFVDDTFMMDGVELDGPEKIMFDADLRKEVDTILTMIGEECKKVLNHFKLGYRYNEIASICNLGNENNARQIAFTCRAKMKDLILKQDKLKDFFENFIPANKVL